MEKQYVYTNEEGVLTLSEPNQKDIGAFSGIQLFEGDMNVLNAAGVFLYEAPVITQGKELGVLTIDPTTKKGTSTVIDTPVSTETIQQVKTRKLLELNVARNFLFKSFSEVSSIDNLLNAGVNASPLATLLKNNYNSDKALIEKYYQDGKLTELSALNLQGSSFNSFLQSIETLKTKTLEI